MSDPFQTLGLPRRFDLDPAQVRRAWLSASGRLHPDRAGGDPLEDGEVARRSALVNMAKRILDDPESRADALVCLLGGKAKEEDKSLPDGFLMEMMTVREDLESAAGDAGRIGELEEWALAQRSGYIERVGGLFASDPGTVALASIRMELNAWRYIERMLEQLQPGPDAQSR